MAERVLVVPRTSLDELGTFQGLCTNESVWNKLLSDRDSMQFMDRDAAEVDPSFKQLIPYLILTHQGRVFCYRRNKKGGEERLHHRLSIGIGGHINDTDLLLEGDVYRHGFERELSEEVELSGGWEENVLGVINDDSTPVGSVHLGIVHRLELVKPKVHIADCSLESLGFRTLEDLRSDWDLLETWSQIVLKHLESQNQG